MIGQLVLKADITIRALPQMVAVDPHIAIRHHAIKFDKDSALDIIRGKRKTLVIPPDASRQEASCTARRVLLVEWAFNAPIVGYIELAPGSIIELRIFST